MPVAEQLPDHWRAADVWPGTAGTGAAAVCPARARSWTRADTGAVLGVQPPVPAGILLPIAGQLHRRLVRDYEHRPSSSASRVYWAMTHVMTRRLTGANAPTWRAAQAVAA